MNKENKYEVAIFGAGCFWHVEEFFSNIKGIKSTMVGYACGKTKEPTYEEVCSGKGGHVEVVKIEFNEKIISYEEILNHFWHIHDPTSLNKQGPDIGIQYKSVICVINDNQADIAKKSISEIQNKFKNRIVTLICKCKKFHKAEEYHQKYLKKNPGFLKTCKITE